jgi:DNA replication and repair protein RecF
MNNNILNFKKNIYNKKDYKNFYIQKLTLKNFRNHGILNLNLKNSSILIYGENGCGKTNILEAISLLSQGKGLRKASIENFLMQEETFNDQHKVWGINVDFIGPNGKFNIGTGLNKSSSKNSRIARVNSDYAPLNSLGKILNLSWITPQLCVLFLSSMSEKRRFIDRLTSSIDSLHLNRVYRYEKLLRQRNKILMQSNFDHTWLDTIEFQISELSIAITARRLDLIDELENLYKTELKNNSLTEYFPSADIVISGKIESLLIEKPAADVEDYIKAELKKSRYNYDLFIPGPNNASIEIFNKKNKKNLDISSTGEQKLLLISIILSHARMLHKKFNMAPILLLDDIIEHLDKEYRTALFLETSRHDAQSWFTSTSKDAFSEFPGFIDKINLPKIKESFDGNYHYRNGDI